MEKIPLTAAGPSLSRLVWGTWRLLEQPDIRDPKPLAAFIDQCLHLGITSFDLADLYGGFGVEEAFGHGLQAWAGDRSAIQLVSKCGIRPVTAARPDNRVKHYDTSRDHILRSVTNSLRALHTDYLDLLLIHRPDPLMDADETADALQEVMAKGWVRHVGVSNHSPRQFSLLQSRLPVPLATNQVEYSILRPDALENGSFDQMQKLRRAPMLWSPLGGGALFTDPAYAPLRAALETVGKKLGHADIGTTALAWALTHPSRPVAVVGTGQIDRLAGYRAALAGLERQDWFTLLEAARGQPVA
jgi:predicted oxidoreductase